MNGAVSEEKLYLALLGMQEFHGGIYRKHSWRGWRYCYHHLGLFAFSHWHLPSHWQKQLGI
jgi:hypothetical protein